MVFSQKLWLDKNLIMKLILRAFKGGILSALLFLCMTENKELTLAVTEMSTLEMERSNFQSKKHLLWLLTVK